MSNGLVFVLIVRVQVENFKICKNKMFNITKVILSLLLLQFHKKLVFFI